MAEFKKELVFSRSYKTTENIAAGATSTERFISQSDVDQYAPFDTLVIVSADSNALGFNLDLNPDNQVPIGASGGASSESQRFADFSITNLGTTEHTAGKIHILVQKFRYVRIIEGM